MTFKDQILELIHTHLLGNSNLFLIDLKVTDTNKITVLIDGDNGVTVQDCIEISRAIDANLDRETNDFSLDVASVGIGSPLKIDRKSVV